MIYAPPKPAQTSPTPALPSIESPVQTQPAEALPIPVETIGSSTQQTTVEDFGKTGKIRQTNPKDSFLDADGNAVLTIDSVKTFGYKKLRFFMTNGQVWEQSGPRDIRVPKARGGNSNTAHITKAALGAYFLRINNKGQALKVKRVR